MKKIKKVISVIQRNIIKLFRYFNLDLYMNLYIKYLKRLGVNIEVIPPMYIDPSAYLDGVDYSKISLGSHVVISREVMLLTHDYSMTRGFEAIGKYTKEVREVKSITIGDNSFIGARVSILPGTQRGKNCIIGAGSVVKGIISDDQIVIGNPAIVIGNTKEWAEKKYMKWIAENNV